nr:DNA-3-methyladenine glycosylase [Naasia sp. SYSU D00057]
MLDAPAETVAPLLLGAVLTRIGEDGPVSLRITEVEAYSGEGSDPGSHAHRGRSRRNEVMFGPSGHLYTYFTYGMHVCANVVCLPEGRAGGLLLRAGEIVEGEELARARRGEGVPSRDLARGPARLAVAMGIPLSDGGSDLFAAPYRLELPSAPAEGYAVSPRTGVSGEGGTETFPWRFFLPHEPTVSPYRRHVPKRRPSAS